MSDKIIQIKEMNKWFGDFQVLKNINLDVEKNKKIVVCGPSGSGKSTLIRCINRLEEHQEGSFVVDHQKVGLDIYMLDLQSELFPNVLKLMPQLLFLAFFLPILVPTCNYLKLIGAEIN